MLPGGASTSAIWLVFDMGDVLERVANHGDLFGTLAAAGNHDA
jgi:hypothetical protein